MVFTNETRLHVVEPERGSLVAARRPSNRRPPPARARRKPWSDVALAEIPRAAEFSSDPSLCDLVSVIEEFRRHPFAEVLEELTNLRGETMAQGLDLTGVAPQRSGRPRLPGDWSALYLGYVMSRSTAVQWFFNSYGTSRLWEVCGFSERPSHALVQKRFSELEDSWRAFALVAQSLVQVAKQAEPLIGKIVAVDASGWHTSAALEHCCLDPDLCRKVGGNPPPRLTSDPNEDILKARWQEAAAFEPTADEREEGQHTRREQQVLLRADGTEVTYQTFVVGGHRYRSLDLSSGLRKYDPGKKVWYGGYLQTATDRLTGLCVAVEVFAADIQEWDGYPSLFERMTEALGSPPNIVSADRGYAIRPFYEFNTRRQVAVVAPRRKRSNRIERIDWRTEGFDEDGIPRCRSCGGEGDQDGPGLGLVFTPRGEPTIRYRCAVPFADGCDGVQSIRCEEEWAMLLPLSRTTELYHSVRYAHHNSEHVYRHARDRYAVAGKDGTGRLRRPGVPPQRLRAWASMLLDWFRLNLRHGWLPDQGLAVTINDAQPLRRSGCQDRRTGLVLDPGDGTAGLTKLLEERRQHGADVPYGEAWKRRTVALVSRPADPHSEGSIAPNGRSTR